MLNELGEYEQYAAPLDSFPDFGGHRLKYFTLIKNGFSGLERALTIIARRHIFADAEQPAAFDEDRVKDILRAWCGFAFTSEVPPALVNRLPEYIKRNFFCGCLRGCRLKCEEFRDDEAYPAVLAFLDATSIESLTALLAAKQKSPLLKALNTDLERAKKILAALDTLSGKHKSFERTVFNVLNDAGDEYRAIKFDRILANALFFGKLRNYVLVCERDPFATAVRKVTDSKPAGKKLLPSQQDLILKLTAMYLLQRRYSDQDFVTFNELSLVSWLATETKPENLHLDKFIFVETGKHLFETRLVGGVNVKKLRVHPDWLKQFRLAEDSETAKRENLGRIFFTDSGAAESLARS